MRGGYEPEIDEGVGGAGYTVDRGLDREVCLLFLNETMKRRGYERRKLSRTRTREKKKKRRKRGVEKRFQDDHNKTFKKNRVISFSLEVEVVTCFSRSAREGRRTTTTSLRDRTRRESAGRTRCNKVGRKEEREATGQTRAVS